MTLTSDGLATFTPGLSERRSSTSSFYHGDALGSTRSQTNSSQSVTDTKRYDAFGMLVASSGSNPTPFGFVGGSQYQTDADSGLMLLGHRYYDASIGRFISRDPAYAGTNWYSYCENNPLGGTDPEGLQALDSVDEAIIQALAKESPDEALSALEELKEDYGTSKRILEPINRATKVVKGRFKVGEFIGRFRQGKVIREFPRYDQLKNIAVRDLPKHLSKKELATALKLLWDTRFEK